MNDNTSPAPFGDEDEATIERLRALGREPVSPALQSRHLTVMAGAPASPSPLAILRQRLRLAAAAIGGAALAVTGMTAAGALGPLQPIAAEVVETVTPLEVPRGPSARAANADEKHAISAADVAAGKVVWGTERYWGDECQTDEDGNAVSNRGLYLRQERAKGAEAFEAARASDCGKPLSALEEDGGDVEALDQGEAGNNGSQGAENSRRPDHAGRPDSHGKSPDAPVPPQGTEPEDAQQRGADAPPATPGPDSAGRPEGAGRPESTPAPPQAGGDDEL